MRILPILFLACGVLSGSLANATTPGKHLQPNAPRTVTVSDTEPPPVILTGQLQATLIVLPPEEKVATVFGGDTVNWVFDGGHVASRFISVKPKTAGSTTDLHIVSDHGNEYTPAEHERHYAPLNRELNPRDAQQFGWVAESGTVQSYQHSTTRRHIHIDGPTGQFYDRQKNPITPQAALDSAVGPGQHHAPMPTRGNQLDQTLPSWNNNQGLLI